jgi:hypothetical protein
MRVLLVMFVTFATAFLGGCVCYDGGGFIYTEVIPPPPYPCYVPPHQTIILRNDAYWTVPMYYRSPHHHGPYRH